jgi:hypothetical protein
MKKLLLLLFLFACRGLPAQPPAEGLCPLVALMQEAAAATDSTQKILAMSAFSAAFEAALRNDGAMDIPFDSIPYVGMLASDDKKVRIFTWHLPLTPLRRHYYGIVQYRVGAVVYTTVLDDRKDSLALRPETAALHNGQWWGALYYELVRKTDGGGRTYYTLLGFDFHTGVMHRKLIEALSFDEQGRPVFGAPIFDNGRWKAHRVLLEYSATTPFFLHYLPRRKMIVYQRLQSETVWPGHPPAGVPIDVFDGLLFHDGRWQLQKEVKLKPKDFVIN